MSMSNGVTGGVFATLADLQASKPRVNTRVELVTGERYSIDAADSGGGVAVNGFFANKIKDLKITPNSKFDYYQETLSDTTLTEVSPEGGDYLAFPVVAQQADGRILVAYMHQSQHTGSAAADVVCKYSDDAGASWSAEIIIYGTLFGSDTINPYFVTLGVDKDDNFVVIFNTYASNPGDSPARPNITRSLNGQVWDAPQTVTFSGDPESASSTIIPFNEIKLLPSGKLAIAWYQGDNNWVGVMDDDVSKVDFDLRLVINSSSPTYSEMAFVPFNEQVWFAFLRLDGATNSIPYLTSDDAGATWVSRGNMGDNGGVEVGGGWVVQSAERVTINGVPSVMVTAGARKSASGTITGSPAIKFFACPASDARLNTGLWDLIHEFALADDGENRDAYASVVTHDAEGNCLLLTHEETAADESRILSGAFNYSETSQNVKLADIDLNSVAVTYTDQVGRFTKIGKQVFFRVEINYTGLDISDTSGIAIIVSGFPFAVVNSGQCSIDTENSTGFTFTAGDDAACNFSSSNVLLQAHKVDGNAWTYNSGKIAASGNVIFFGQYETV